MPFYLSRWGDFKTLEEYPQIRALRLLLSYGADIRRRPYVWFRVNDFSNEWVNSVLKQRYWNAAIAIIPPTNDGLRNDLFIKRMQEADELANRMEMEDKDSGKWEEQFKEYVDAYNRVIKAFLEAGADPDQKGHPYPFSLEATKKGMDDESANKYFAKGTRAINEAIEKGILWESQVDLLLQYTKLDEESLKAARRSNDPKMIEKIDALWKKQSGR